MTTQHGRKTAGLPASPRVLVGAALVVLSVWFVLINTRTVRIHFWVFWAQAPMWLVLVVTFLAGAAASWLFQRRRRQDRPHG
ncbi:LapA family protein [Streptomyces sp. NBC_00503]|uniref:LapA family protein n=1 Tax=Streptomyces sp. NBC_00503 TaxID=2903659 RepID=UPI002E814225|nr:LapA family protein [Streptomyces sp. NBC_00503]WUD79363.1 LapA family protein [Streptomyces sp. NBC_00503]